jgi:phosphotransferase system  glucose/maltose/N-acetylglucosamine-specific IIC component
MVPVESDASPLSEAASAVGDADELAIPLLAVAFALGLALASLYVVYAAPMLFAELLVDGALSYALYRRIKAADSPHWLESAVRRTALPFVLTGVFVSVTGAAMAVWTPGAHSIGQVIQKQEQH